MNKIVVLSLSVLALVSLIVFLIVRANFMPLPKLRADRYVSVYSLNLGHFDGEHVKRFINLINETETTPQGFRDIYDIGESPDERITFSMANGKKHCFCIRGNVIDYAIYNDAGERTGIRHRYIMTNPDIFFSELDIIKQEIMESLSDLK